MLELARTAWAMVSLALVAVFVWALMVLPERVPQHLDASGTVTEWGSKTTLLVGMLIGIATTVSLGPLAHGIGRTLSLDLVSVPHKDRWLPTHEGALRARVATDLYAVGASTGCLLTGIQAGMVAVALGEPRLPTWAVGIAVVAVLALAAQIVAMLTVRYRSPE